MATAVHAKEASRGRHIVVDVVSKVQEVGLREERLDLLRPLEGLVGERGEEVALQAPPGLGGGQDAVRRRARVKSDLVVGKRAVRNAAAQRIADARRRPWRVGHGSIDAIPAKAVDGVKDGRGVELGAAVLGVVKRPVPEGVRANVAALGLERLLVDMEQVAMPREENAIEMNAGPDQEFWTVSVWPSTRATYASGGSTAGPWR
jgi:hypothetical protein